jgi:ElaB/YqjD/DUF883 family membrane-anchored ribosome-binding protein
MWRARAVSVSVFFLILTVTSVAAQKSPKSYSAAEVEAKLNSLQSNVESEIGTKLAELKSRIDSDAAAAIDELKSSLQTEIGKRLDDFRKSLPPAGITKTELNAAILTASNDLRQKIDNATKTTDDKIKALDDKVSKQPPWFATAALGAALGFLASLLMSVRADRQRASEEARNAAHEFVQNWNLNLATISNVDALFSDPTKIDDSGKNQIIGIGNTYQILAEKWRSNRIDRDILERHEMFQKAKTFWQNVERLKTATPVVDMSAAQSSWPQLRLLAT